jgi:hypothetical protein
MPSQFRGSWSGDGALSGLVAWDTVAEIAEDRQQRNGTAIHADEPCIHIADNAIQCHYNVVQMWYAFGRLPGHQIFHQQIQFIESYTSKDSRQHITAKRKWRLLLGSLVRTTINIQILMEGFQKCSWRIKHCTLRTQQLLFIKSNNEATIFMIALLLSIFKKCFNKNYDIFQMITSYTDPESC